MPFTYPSNYDVSLIEPELVSSTMEGRLPFDPKYNLCPVVNKNAGEIRWTQMDSSYGLQGFRGLNGEPTRVQRVNAKTYTYEPGVFGEYEVVDEAELTKRAGTFPTDITPIPVDDIISDIDRLLLGRQWDRMEASFWSVAAGTLTLSKPGPNNTTIAYTDTYPVQNITAGVSFSNLSGSSPIAFFQQVQQLQVGRSVDFGAGAIAVANNATLFNILNNTNAADFGGRRGQAGATINNLGALNNYWQAQNLPQLIGYDNGYYNTLAGAAAPGTGNFTKFVPNNKIFVFGKRPGGAPVMQFYMTRNANNPGSAPGPYRYIVDRVNATNAEKRTPPNIEVHRGVNGGPAVLYPSAVAVLNV